MKQIVKKIEKIIKPHSVECDIWCCNSYSCIYKIIFFDSSFIHACDGCLNTVVNNWKMTKSKLFYCCQDL